LYEVGGSGCRLVINKMTSFDRLRHFGAYVPAILIGAGAVLIAVLGTRSPLAAREGPATLAAQASPYDWLQYNGNSRHDGNNTQETVLGMSNVASLQFLFQATLPSSGTASVADGAPVYLANVATPGGTRDLLFVTTRAGHIIALDAATGAQVWSHQYGAGTCKINNGSSPCYTTSHPAIDPNRLYVYSYGLDGYVHKYQVGDGLEITTGGWPELATLKGFNEKGSSALSFATAVSGATYLYVNNGGYPGDNGDYQGHVTAINLADGTQKVFNALCSDQAVHFVETPGAPDCSQVQSAIWARVGVVYDNVTDRISMATGNGFYDGVHNWGETVFSLNPDGSGSGGEPLDTYTPANFASLTSADLDVGSTAPAILPAAGYAGRLAVQSGKDANLRLINLANLSGQGGPGHTGGEIQILPVPQGGQVLTTPAVWINPLDGSTWVFVTNGSGSSGLKLTVSGGVPMLGAQWHNNLGGFSPLVANGVLYFAGSNIIRALNPLTGSVLWSDSTHVGGIHWESPVVVNATLYITDESAHLTAYALPPPAPTPTPTPSVGKGFFTVTPCRVADTRNPPGPSGGPALAANTVRAFPVSGLCGIPPSATSVAINLAVVLPGNGGFLRVYPAGVATPPTSSINFRSGDIRANNAVVALGAGGQISVQCVMSSGGTDFVFDVFGYFQ
jgi:outer membrane protein assembly factor BamB